MFKKKNLLVIAVLLFVVSMVFVGCDDNEQLEILEKQNSFIKLNISFDQLNAKLSKYSTYIESQLKVGGEDEFIINLETDNIIEFETEDTNTYTLKANTIGDDQSSFTNIIYIEKNNQLKKYLIKYIPTQEWKTQRLTNPEIPYSGDTKLLNLDGDILDQNQIIEGFSVPKNTTGLVCYYEVVPVYQTTFDLDHLVGYEYELIGCISDGEPEDNGIEEGDSGGGGTDTSGDSDPPNNGGGEQTDNGNDDSSNETNNNEDDDGEPIITDPVLGDNNDDDGNLLMELNELLCTPITANQYNEVGSEIIEQIYNFLFTTINPDQGECSDANFDLLDSILNSGNFDIDDESPNAKEAALFVIFHIQAPLHIQNSITALNKAQEVALTLSDGTSGLHNGRADAFRHAFWNALGTAEFGGSIMKLFADAHEWGQTNQTEVVMDLHNNQEGRNVAIVNFYGISTSETVISQDVLDLLFNGTLRYINNGQITPTNP
jgi:hypothetical protein